jgi:hypothetical protein
VVSDLDLGYLGICRLSVLESKVSRKGMRWRDRVRNVEYLVSAVWHLEACKDTKLHLKVIIFTLQTNGSQQIPTMMLQYLARD